MGSRDRSPGIPRAIAGPTALAIVEGGASLLVGTVEGFIEVRTLGTGELLRRMRGTPRDLDHDIIALAPFPDNHRVAVAAAHGELSVWNIDDAARVLTCGSGETDIRSLTMSPDGSAVVTGDVLGRVRQWRIDRCAEPQWAVRVSERTVNAVVFAPDGRLVAAAGDDGKVNLRDTAYRAGRRHVGASSISCSRAGVCSPHSTERRVRADGPRMGSRWSNGAPDWCVGRIGGEHRGESKRPMDGVDRHRQRERPQLVGYSGAACR